MHCYLCGSADNVTRDHIPPGGFFPSPRPTDLLTVPCCGKCNNAFSDDDDVMRLYLSAHISRSAAGDWIWENSVLPRTVPRRPAIVDSLLASTRDLQVSTPTGPVDATAYELDAARVERFLIRVTKGLLTHHHPEHDYREAAFEVRLIDPAPENLKRLESVRDLFPHHSRGQGVFQYRGGLTDSKMSGMWLLVFYDASLFLVSHTKNDWGKSA